VQIRNHLPSPSPLLLLLVLVLVLDPRKVIRTFSEAVRKVIGSCTEGVQKPTEGYGRPRKVTEGDPPIRAGHFFLLLVSFTP
jgi:hypothetical protein